MTTERKQRKPIKRGDSIRLRIASDVLIRLDRLAALYGVPRATIASLAIGQYVTQQERSTAVIDRMADGLGEEMGKQFREAIQEQLKLVEEEK